MSKYTFDVEAAIAVGEKARLCAKERCERRSARVKKAKAARAAALHAEVEADFNDLRFGAALAKESVLALEDPCPPLSNTISDKDGELLGGCVQLDDGRYVTAYHVLEDVIESGSAELHVCGTRVQAIIDEADLRADIVWFRIDAETLLGSRPVPSDEIVRDSIGTVTLRAGEVKVSLKYFKDNYFISYGNLMGPGCSGLPVLVNGKVVAIYLGAMPGDIAVFSALPIGFERVLMGISADLPALDLSFCLPHKAKPKAAESTDLIVSADYDSDASVGEYDEQSFDDFVPPPLSPVPPSEIVVGWKVPFSLNDDGMDDVSSEQYVNSIFEPHSSSFVVVKEAENTMGLYEFGATITPEYFYARMGMGPHNRRVAALAVKAYKKLKRFFDGLVDYDDEPSQWVYVYSLEEYNRRLRHLDYLNNLQDERVAALNEQSVEPETHSADEVDEFSYGDDVWQLDQETVDEIERYHDLREALDEIDDDDMPSLAVRHRDEYYAERRFYEPHGRRRRQFSKANLTAYGDEAYEAAKTRALENHGKADSANIMYELEMSRWFDENYDVEGEADDESDPYYYWEQGYVDQGDDFEAEQGDFGDNDASELKKKNKKSHRAGGYVESSVGYFPHGRRPKKPVKGDIVRNDIAEVAQAVAELFTEKPKSVNPFDTEVVASTVGDNPFEGEKGNPFDDVVVEPVVESSFSETETEESSSDELVPDTPAAVVTATTEEQKTPDEDELSGTEEELAELRALEAALAAPKHESSAARRIRELKAAAAVRTPAVDEPVSAHTREEIARAVIESKITKTDVSKIRREDLLKDTEAQIAALNAEGYLLGDKIVDIPMHATLNLDRLGLETLTKQYQLKFLQNKKKYLEMGRKQREEQSKKSVRIQSMLTERTAEVIRLTKDLEDLRAKAVPDLDGIQELPRKDF